MEPEKDSNIEESGVKEEISEVDQLRKKIEELEAQLEELSKESDKKILEFVDKKSKEALEIIKSKEVEISDKYRREYEKTRKYLYEKQFSDLVAIISQFENVIDSTVNPEVSAYLAGFKMFSSKFNDLLSDLNISILSPKLHEEFNPETMEASSIKTVLDKSLDNKILEIFSKGYMLHDRMIKLAAVEVGKYEGVS